ncbi:MAG: hypothetical protein M5U28_18250 [Sandaracinaceae bacterium]|nr:hypothetical protein [Sandaracinaceae bacterium]
MQTEVGHDVYRRFAAIWANGEPVRSAREVGAMIRAAGKREADITDEWLRALPHAWVYGASDDPFPDERANRQYRRELEGEK